MSLFLFEWDEDSLQSTIKPITFKSLPESELERIKKIWEDIISWTMQRTLEEWSSNKILEKLGNSNNLNIPHFFR